MDKDTRVGIAAVAVIVVIIFFYYYNTVQKEELERRWEAYDQGLVSEGPIQVPYEDSDPVVIQKGGHTYTLTRLAEYKATVIIPSKMFQYDHASAISPIDLVFTWGDLASPEYGGYVTCKSYSRHYICKLKPNLYISALYAETHSSNNHIIPANDNVYEGIKSIGTNQVAYLEGYLVNVESDIFSKPWETSLNRVDTGFDSCEIFYVERAVVEGRTYE
jgi:hypothetical protein